MELKPALIDFPKPSGTVIHRRQPKPEAKPAAPRIDAVTIHLPATLPVNFEPDGKPFDQRTQTIAAGEPRTGEKPVEPSGQPKPAAGGMIVPSSMPLPANFFQVAPVPVRVSEGPERSTCHRFVVVAFNAMMKSEPDTAKFAFETFFMIGDEIRAKSAHAVAPGLPGYEMHFAKLMQEALEGITDERLLQFNAKCPASAEAGKSRASLHRSGRRLLVDAVAREMQARGL